MIKSFKHLFVSFIYNKMKFTLHFSSLEKQLNSCDNKTPLFSLEDKVKLCKVVNVYDGDTCKVVFRLNDQVHRWNIRMDGYDTPEMRPSKSKPNRDEEIIAAKAAKEYLKGLVMNENQLVYIKCGKFDKYGRLLGTLYIKKNDLISVNQMMIDNKHGYPYHGGTKKQF